MPAMRQQFLDPAGPVYGQSRQHIPQVGIGIVPVHGRRVMVSHWAQAPPVSRAGPATLGQPLANGSRTARRDRGFRGYRLDTAVVDTRAAVAQREQGCARGHHSWRPSARNRRRLKRRFPCDHPWKSCLPPAVDTSDTSPKNMRYQLEPACLLADPPDTSDTSTNTSRVQ